MMTRSLLAECASGLPLGAPRSERSTPGRRGGFTLLELLVVIAVVAILATLGFSAAIQAKQQAQSIRCLNNDKQLTLALFCYVDDNQDWLPHNYGVADTYKTIADETYLNWANNVMTWELEPENTNAVLAATGGIAPYLSGEIEPFRCPSDYTLSDIQLKHGWRQRVRSYSMNAMLGYAGEYTKNGTNVNNPYYRQFYKYSEISKPSDIFIFIEEHPDSINDGYFVNRSSKLEWVDLPASYHREGANLSFADGHSEFRKWRFPSTLKPARPDGAELPYDIDPAERGDFDWLMKRMSVGWYYKKY